MDELSRFNLTAVEGGGWLETWRAVFLAYSGRTNQPRTPPQGWRYHLQAPTTLMNPSVCGELQSATSEIWSAAGDEELQLSKNRSTWSAQSGRHGEATAACSHFSLWIFHNKSPLLWYFKLLFWKCWVSICKNWWSVNSVWLTPTTTKRLHN